MAFLQILYGFNNNNDNNNAKHSHNSFHLQRILQKLLNNFALFK